MRQILRGQTFFAENKKISPLLIKLLSIYPGFARLSVQTQDFPDKFAAPG
jgi:hypothetical protein